MSTRLLVVGQLPPPVHGSNAMTELFMTSLRNIGYDVSIVQKTFSKKQEDVGKFSWVKLMKIPTIAVNLVNECIRRRPKVCYFFISVGLPSLLVDLFLLFLLRLLRIDYVLYFHGKGFTEYSGKAAGQLVRAFFFRALGGLILGERLKEDLSWCIPQERLFILPNAVPDQAGMTTNERKFDKDDVTVLFLSNLNPTKGPMEFLMMATLVAKRFPRVRFVLAGPRRTEDFYQKLLDFIREEGLKKRVVVPGGLFEKAKNDVFQDSDIFVFPTWYKRETFGLVNIEAMQWRLPVISTPEGAIPEAVLDGITGFIVNPKDIETMADRVVQLIEDPGLRRKMGEAGRAHYERCYTIDVYEKRLGEAIEFFSLLQRNRAG